MKKKIEITAIPELKTSVGMHGSLKQKEVGGPVCLGILIAILAALVPLNEIVKLVNIGTLFAFILVNVGVIVLRYTRPDMPRPFRVPLSPVLPIIGIAFAST